MGCLEGMFPLVEVDIVAEALHFRAGHWVRKWVRLVLGEMMHPS